MREVRAYRMRCHRRQAYSEVRREDISYSEGVSNRIAMPGRSDSGGRGAISGREGGRGSNRDTKLRLRMGKHSRNGAGRVQAGQTGQTSGKGQYV